MKAIDPKAKVPYIAECDRELPKDEQVTAFMTQLTAAEDAYIKDRIHNIGEAQLAALALGLDSVEGLVLNGKPFVLERDMTKAPLIGKKRPWKDESLSVLPKEVRDEYAGVILSGRAFKEAEIKNS